jgi:putative PEP-CTERM system histidine kinase
MPLIYETKLIGFIILNEPKIYTSLNWEDLDLLKITGRQIASYIEGHRKSEALSQAKQFETFNKLSAFVMHDLKNLIAQQSLLTENAAKHKDNPAFIDDAFNTIRGSVDRLNVLLQKLQRSEPEAARSIDLKPVLIEAIGRCSRTLPIPSLRLDKENSKLLAAPDTLCMVFVHLIQNAQEATKPTGFVDIHVEHVGNQVQIKIDDNGKGMDEHFVQHSLFKPFETTKTGKGMGIGVYQAKDYIEHLGGSVIVTSQIDVGTTFTLTLPLLIQSQLNQDEHSDANSTGHIQ